MKQVLDTPADGQMAATDEGAAKLPHVAFFETLGSMSTSDPDWLPLSAGLLVLRLVDAWLTPDDGVDSSESLRYAVRSVQDTVEALPATYAARSILLGLVSAIADAPLTDVRLLAPRLMAYGRSLEYEAKWNHASDAYRTILRHAHPAIEADLVFDATLRLAVCLRTNGDLGGAEAEYHNARQLALAIADAERVLRARNGDAKIAIARGNLPAAEAILIEILDQAATDGTSDVRAMTLHELAGVAYARGQYERAIHLGYDALKETHNLRERDRILADLGTCFMDSNMFSSARDALLVVASTATEQYVRWAATTNLLEIAVREGSQTIFELYRRELANTQLPAAIATRYHYCVGMGYSAFDQLEESIEALERSHQIAESNGLNQQMFETETLLQEVRRGLRVQRTAATAVPESMFEVTEALSEMREQLV